MRLLPLLASLLTATAHAGTLKTQFDQPIEVPGTAGRVFFASDMDASKLVQQAFGAASTDRMADAGVLYVADVSKMPAMVGKLFAKPKMRKLPYRIALDEDGALTANWPRAAGQVTVIEGEAHRFCANAACLEAALAPAAPAE